MKKRDEGYVLPLVLVVMVILCLVAVSVMSFALNNYKSQQASVQRMQDQYAAQGEIEKIVAKLDNLGNSQFFVVDGQDLKVAYVAPFGDQTEPVLTLTAEKGTVLITCQLKVTENAPNLTVTDVDGKQKFTLTGTGPVTYEFATYKISTADPAEEGSSADDT